MTPQPAHVLHSGRRLDLFGEFNYIVDTEGRHGMYDSRKSKPIQVAGDVIGYVNVCAGKVSISLNSEDANLRFIKLRYDEDVVVGGISVSYETFHEQLVLKAIEVYVDGKTDLDQ